LRRFLHGPILIVLIVLASIRCAAGLLPPAVVLVASGSNVPAFDEAISGIRTALANSGAGVLVLSIDSAGSVKLTENLRHKPRVVVAVGSAAWRRIVETGYDGPVILTMVLHSTNSETTGKPVGSVTIDLPPSIVLARLSQLYPERKRIAIVRGPELPPALMADAENQSRKLGYQVHILDCQKPRELLDKVGALRGRVDFLLTFPDSTLYSGPVVSALILSGIRNGIPLVGFSEGMVRSGALIGFFADYQDIGVQTGESVLLCLSGQTIAKLQAPRRIKTAVNERVMRVLGVQHAPDMASSVVSLR
jgi:ABC-type uncharacterized transport system substrate-binding protein